MRVLFEDFIVVSPHIQSGQYYHNPGTMQRIIDDIVATHNADPAVLS